MEKFNAFSNYLERKDGRLFFDGCDVNSVAEKYGTPAYVLSASGLKERLCEIRDTFIAKYDNVLPLYASKALSTPYVYKEAEAHGLGVDVVSSGEMYVALKSGTSPEKIYFHGSNKADEEIIFALENNVLNFIIDNFHEIELIQKLASAAGKTVRGMIRIVPQVEAGGHKHIKTGITDTKFGFSTHDDTYLRAVKLVDDCSAIEFIGIHCHVGSQILELQPFLDTAAIMSGYAISIHEQLGLAVNELNIGGGYGISYLPDQHAISFGEVIPAVMDTIEAAFSAKGIKRPKILMEPGRSIIGNAVVTLYTVGSRKDIPEVRSYVSVDGGMSDNIRAAMYDAKYTAFLGDTCGRAEEETVTIAGKCCESGDILIRDVSLPTLKAGDTLAVMSSGAYHYSMASNYNQLRRPPIVLLEKGTSKLIVRRETYEDLLKTTVE